MTNTVTPTTDKPRIGACDICNVQNVEITHGYVSGLETFYCANGCPGPDEIRARANGWILEIEYNEEDDGVRHPASGNWAEHWKGACAQIDAAKKS